MIIDNYKDALNNVIRQNVVEKKRKAKTRPSGANRSIEKDIR